MDEDEERHKENARIVEEFVKMADEKMKKDGALKVYGVKTNDPAKRIASHGKNLQIQPDRLQMYQLFDAGPYSSYWEIFLIRELYKKFPKKRSWMCRRVEAVR